MADEPLGERTEKPTPKKRSDALKKGEVPRSQEVTTAFLLLAGALALSAGGATLARSVTEVFGYSVAKVTSLPTGVSGSAAYMRLLGWRVMAGSLTRSRARHTACAMTRARSAAPRAAAAPPGATTLGVLKGRALRRDSVRYLSKR